MRWRTTQKQQGSRMIIHPDKVTGLGVHQKLSECTVRFAVTFDSFLRPFALTKCKSTLGREHSDQLAQGTWNRMHQANRDG